MTRVEDINLLIFDLDGTLFKSDRANYEAIKRAISELGFQVLISEELVREHLGEPSEVFYKNILPPEKHEQWKEFRRKVREQYNSSIKKFGEVFPGVSETLQALKRREYTLALYSNCSIQYFNVALSILEIQQFFDYVECTQEYDLTKTKIIQKIKRQFSGLEAAVIGDRIHDIEAARRNNTLSVGVLYGYGRDEPKQADITITKPLELLTIFDRRVPIYKKILTKVKERKKRDRAFVVGITGIDTSGKTQFASGLEKCLKSRGYKVQTIHLDDFHNPKSVRYSGESQADNYYLKSFNLSMIKDKLLIPISQKRRVKESLILLDLQSDQYDIQKEYDIDENTIVIFEGVFLFRKELVPYIDYKVFLDIPFEEAKKRALKRDVSSQGYKVLQKYDDKYLPAQRKYLRRYPPETADLIIDNSNWDFPKIKG